MRFFLQAALALVLIYLVTLLLDPSPAVTAIRGGILFGLALTAVKIVLRRYDIAWLSPRRTR